MRIPMKSNPKKAAALAALMECGTFTEAAKQAGIDRKTLYNYMTMDRDFAKAYREGMERATIERAEASALLREKAQETIISIMEDDTQPAAVRLKAAQAIMAEAAEAASANVKLNNANIDRTGWSGRLEEMLEAN